MDETPEPRYFCPVCQTGFSDEALEKRLAIRRYHEVYCREHFRKKFPDECLEHPGTPVTTKCSICGRRVCENCYITLRGKKVCRLCKPAEMAEIVTGQPARRVVRHWWRPVTIGKDVVRRLVRRRTKRVMQEWFVHEDSGSQRRHQQWVEPHQPRPGIFIFVLGLLSIILPICIPYAFIKYMSYRNEVTGGSVAPTRMAEVGLGLILAAILLWAWLLLSYFTHVL